ncbi:putative serine/threonine-protein kinase [Gossypium australe]|uniref:Putative serine/threonine-protein kinase n=1 Tax=Gossypium australe TaxID=47621 RepID=A0A5B6V2M2_9ROSI|nr:putative serine/threonine-protein kinase [Gossypium australe]
MLTIKAVSGPIADTTARLISNQQSGSASGSLSNDERSRKDLSQLQRLPTRDATTWGGQRQPRITRVMSGERGGLKCYMQQLLNGLDHRHSLGVLHRDIKGANLLRDYNGNLKIGDFGLAAILRPNQMQPLTSRIVTLWYRPTELLLGSTDYGVTIDLWSPIMPGRTEVEQLHRIFKLCGSPSEEYWKRSKLPNATVFKPQHPYKRCVNQTFKDFPTSTLALLDMLLAVEPECRGIASSALQSEFFTTSPLPCDPSSLPKYPPSKEFDVKLRGDESARQRASREKVNGNDRARKASAIPAPDSNFELQASIQPYTRSVNGVNNPGIPVEPLQGTSKPVCSHVDPSMHLGNAGSSHNMKANEVKSTKACARAFGSPSQANYVRHGATTLSQFSNLVSIRGRSRLDMSNPQWHEEHFNGGYDHDGNVQSTHHLFDRLSTSHLPSEKSTTIQIALAISGGDLGKKLFGLWVMFQKEKRIHYSGPLMPSGHGRDLEEMLKEHERRMQNAVRKAHLDKTKTLARNSFDNNRQTESLLCVAVNRR